MTSTSPRRHLPRGRGAELLVGGVAAVTLAATTAACGEREVRPPPQGVITLDADPTGTGDALTPSPSSAAQADPSPPTETSAPSDRAAEPPAVRALRTAQAALPRAQLLTLEDEEADGWHVDLLRPGGQVVLVVVSPDGTQVQGAPRPGEADEEDVAALGRVQVGALEALQRALDLAPQDAVETLELDDDDGRLAWEVDFAVRGTVLVDAVSGDARPD